MCPMKCSRCMRVAPIKRTYRYDDEDDWGAGRMFANYCASCVSKLPANYKPPGTYSYDYDYRRESDRIEASSVMGEYKKQFKPSTRKFKRPWQSGRKGRQRRRRRPY